MNTCVADALMRETFAIVIHVKFEIFAVVVTAAVVVSIIIVVIVVVTTG